MGNVIILNGSPRAVRSNSKKYAEIFIKSMGTDIQYMDILKNNHEQLCRKIAGFSDVLLVFPLYADSIPVTLLNFLKVLEKNPPDKKPVVSVLINCGFLEYWQNDQAVEIIKLFCRENGYAFGSVLKIGGGEAILGTPFKIFAVSKIKKLAKSIKTARYRTFYVTMPITAKMFVKASTIYWESYGRKNGITKEEMDTVQIEGTPVKR